MAAGQLSSRRRADPRDSRGSAAGILSSIAEARGRSARRLSRVYSAWRGHSSPTATADSTRSRCDCSCAPISACSRSPSESCGRSPSRFASCWSRTCAARPRASSSSRAARQDADTVADRLLGVNGYAVEPDALLRRDARGRVAPCLRRPAGAAAARSGSAITPARGWLDDRLTSQGTTADELVHESISGRAHRASRCATSSPA